jgi:hypothetical protein
MNANELANLLEVDSWYKLVTREEIAIMLRQQQAEIDALKKEKWLTEIDAKQQALKQIIDMLVLQHDTLACTSFPLNKRLHK